MKVFYVSTIFRDQKIAKRFLIFFKKNFPKANAELLLYCHDNSTFNVSKQFKSKNINIFKGSESVFYTEALNILIREIMKRHEDGNICILDSDCFTTRNLHQICISNKKRGLIFRNRDFKTKELLPAGFKIKNNWTGASVNIEDQISNKKKHFYKVDYSNGRGLTFPLKFVKKYGLLNYKDFPLYASDNEYSWRLSRNIGLFYCTKAEILSNKFETNLNSLVINYSIKKRIKSLFSIRSNINIIVRYKYIKAICPKKKLIPLWAFRSIGNALLIAFLPFFLVKKLSKFE